MDLESFSHEVENSSIASASKLDVDSAHQLYNSTLSIILDKMLPIKTIRIHQRSSDPWLIKNVMMQNVSKENLNVDTRKKNVKLIWKPGSIKNKYTEGYVDRRKEYWNAKLMDPKRKSSNTWKFINKISGRGKKSAVNINAQEYHSYLLEKTETAKIFIRSSEAPEFSKCNENLS